MDYIFMNNYECCFCKDELVILIGYKKNAKLFFSFAFLWKTIFREQF
jgi:hypothetical protein